MSSTKKEGRDITKYLNYLNRSVGNFFIVPRNRMNPGYRVVLQTMELIVHMEIMITSRKRTGNTNSFQP